MYRAIAIVWGNAPESEEFVLAIDLRTPTFADRLGTLAAKRARPSVPPSLP